MFDGLVMRQSLLVLLLCVVLGCSSSGDKEQALKKRGVEVVFEIDSTSLSSAQVSNIDRLQELVTNQIRARSLLIDRAAIVKQDRGFITVEMPNKSDENAVVKELTKHKTHGRSVGFYNAWTVSAYDGSARLFQVGRQLKYQGKSCYALLRTDSQKEILPGTSVYDVVIKGWKSPIIGGEDLAWVELEPSNGVPALRFTPDAAEKLATWCKAQTRETQLAIVMEGLIVSIAPLKNGTILSDAVAIDGLGDKGPFEKLAKSVNSNSLSADLLVRSQRKF